MSFKIEFFIKSKILYLFPIFILFILFNTNSYAKEKYSSSILCSSIYYIALGAYEDNTEAKEIMIGRQQAFEIIYTANQSNSLSQGQIWKIKHEHLMYIGELFDSDPNKIYQLEMQCNSWAVAIGEEYNSLLKSTKDPKIARELVKTFPKFKRIIFTSENNRWLRSKNMMNSGFEYWDSNERMTAHKAKEIIKKQSSILEEEPTVTFEDGSTYIGDVVNGNMDGIGTFISVKNEADEQLIYSGEFKDGKFNGAGQLDFYNGDSYIGSFSDGFMHGSGILKYQNGAEYTGIFNKGNKEGKGRLLYSDGVIYEGDFKNDNIEGIGKIIYEPGNEYKGEFLNNVMHGKGTIIFKDGSSYKGFFISGQYNGLGKFVFPDGTYYEGEFKNGYRDGPGELVYIDKTKQSGNFKNGDFIGEVVITFPDGTVQKQNYKE